MTKALKSSDEHSFVDGPFGSNLKTIHFVENGTVLVIESGFITSGEFVMREFKTITNEHYETIKRSSCIAGDIIIAKIGANYGMSGILPELNKKSVVSGNSLKLTVNIKLYLNKFIHLQLLTLKAKGIFDLMVTTTAQPALSLGGLNNLSMPVTSLSEQLSIIKYLDNKTSQIDTLIEKKQKLIELLKEYRNAIINQAVTKGLNPDTPMKDSGIEWLGEVPEHWRYGKIIYYSILKTGGTPDRGNPEYWENGTINWMSSGEVNKKIVYKIDNKITEEGMMNSNAKLLPINSVMIALNGQGKTKGTVAILKVETTCNQSLAAFICDEKNLHYKYVYYFLDNKYKELRGLVGDDLRDGLTLMLLKSLYISLPPYIEQHNIVNFIDVKISQIDIFIKQQQQQISLLKEYRTTLISDVVTGKIDVRGEV